MLTGKQKRYLRKEAHHLSPVFQVGKSGINKNMLDQIDETLEKRELIKVSVLQNNFEDKHDLADQIAKGTDALVVQIIGNIIVLYRESVEKNQIELP
ncbi:ribosome assembly RNA-binding protein YhbY [Alkalibacillus haloalkaliphilus]|uniref:RNA-binding protein n=1 Tax=Alkalibacillus haloalkaliphilus TaxID=94136 RepID=A0A511W8U7_9BACI|nr:ribosome assembly RNA-binding protein YhbY [Alkalibacillus haloalkaliphilus]GEN46473.1 RNA-binding protein [Alkalibacillus haloalkaliphilus]